MAGRDSLKNYPRYHFCSAEENVMETVCANHEEPGLLCIKKELLEFDLQSLQNKLTMCQQVEGTYNRLIQHLEKQVKFTENKIKAQFENLRQFLEEEEKSRLEILREEAKQKEKTIHTELEKLQAQISSLPDIIHAVEDNLQKGIESFHESYKTTRIRSRTQCLQPDPHLLSGVLLDEAKHLGNLSFRVWEKMKKEVHFSPVILDPNTANQQLYLSDDLTTITCGNTSQELPENPERNTKHTSVLGSKSFNSGKHSWDVEVGDHPDWLIGLVKESIDRKRKLHVSASSTKGIWCLKHRDGRYTNVFGNTIPLQKNPHKITVQLDYDGGKVSFYNTEDLSHIYTYKNEFTDKLYPYFRVDPEENGKPSEIKICQTAVSLKFSKKESVVETINTK